MANWKTTLEKVLSGRADRSIDYKAFCALIEHLGYELDRQRGSHKWYRQRGWEPMPVQPEGGKAKDYQVRDLRKELKEHGY